MANFVTSAAMNLPIPVVGVAPGPDWAAYVNNCLTLIDQHVHSAGSGNQITPDGLNISGDLSFKQNNATLLRTSRYVAQSGTLAGPSDLGCVYVSGIDLYFNDANGNPIRITQSGGIAGSPGSIANLTSPASATYSAGTQTFVWQSGANLPANLDAGSVIVRNLSVNSNGITISPPNALASNYVLTLPATPPASTKIVVMDSSGNLSPVYDADNVTIEVASNLLQLKNGGITTAKIAGGQITAALMAASSVGSGNIQANTIQDGNIALGTINQNKFAAAAYGTGSYGGGTVVTSSGVYQTLATCSVFGSVTGRPIFINILPSGTTGVWSVASDLRVRVQNAFGTTREMLIPSGARHPINHFFTQSASNTGIENFIVQVDTQGNSITIPAFNVFLTQG